MPARPGVRLPTRRPMHPLRPVPILLRSLLVGCASVAAASAQNDLLQALRGAGLTPGVPGQQNAAPNLLGPNLQSELFRYIPGGFRPRGANAPMLQGLPVVPPPDFRAYPGGRLPIPFLDAPIASMRPIAADVALSENAWPAWFEGPEKSEPGGFTASVAIVAQITDYVWVREDEAPAAAPLIWFDRFRVVESGTELAIRGGGHAALAFHRGGRVRIEGRAEVAIRALETDAVDLDFGQLERVEITAGDRSIRIAIGAGGTFEVLGTRGVLHREGNFVAFENRGPGEVRFETRGRAVLVPPGHRVTVLPRPTGEPPSTALRLDGGVRTGRDGRDLLVEAPDTGAVEWNGARFELPVGGRLRIDPLAGDAFPDHRSTDG